MVRRLLRILKPLSSLKLTVVTLSLIILAVIPATLIPQNLTAEHYIHSYPSTLAYLILALGYDHFFSSPLFLSLLGIFWINLLSCTLKRFFHQLRGRGRKQFGPDILHLGLLLLIMASMVSFTSRREGLLYLKPGDAVQLPSGRYMVLDEFIYEQYPGGRPKSWVSRVHIADSPDETGQSYEIAVNHPLRIDRLVIYQTGYRPSHLVGEYEPGLTVSSDPGKVYVLISFLIMSFGLMLTVIQKGRGPKRSTP